MIAEMLETLPQYIIEQRKLKNLTQQNIADLTGCNINSIQRYESDNYLKCPLNRLVKIVAAIENA